ncbi:copper homeostasis protein CutC [Proteiniclasticum sp. C24MP]|uniref:copper homeostasis protein CutC n=1 Tax=Proteiniclasticum sp. C24MP TaxID=3374101 RepID=UPI0037550432
MLEIIAETLEDALIIEKSGGDRIELVASLSEGGLTPSYGLVKQVISQVSIPVNVMIRPHSASFEYSREDLEVMREDARVFNELGVKHVVLGILDFEGLPNMEALSYILEDTNLTATFHRAIDESSDLPAALHLLETNKRITHILTSGGPGKAEDHLEMIRKLIHETDDITMILASGITKENLQAIRNHMDFALEGEESAQKEYDIHVGTAVRGGSVGNAVRPEEVAKLRAIYDLHRIF